MQHTIREVHTPEDLALCHKVRNLVFTIEQGYRAEDDIDELDPKCKHWVAVDKQGEPVGTLRLYIKPTNRGKVGRVAVLSSTRGQGLGKKLMDVLEQYVIDNNIVPALELSSQHGRMPFYQKCGFVEQGDVYLEEGQPHIFMTKVLTA